MKSTYTRILAMLLCLALTFGLCVSMVQAAVEEDALEAPQETIATATDGVAEEATEETTEATEDADTDVKEAAEDDTVEEITPYVSVNPIFGNTVDTTETKLAGAQKVSAPSTYHTSLESLFKEARQLAVARNTYFEVGYKTTSYLHSTIAQTLADGMHEHTGNPKEGDYLTWNGFACNVGGNASYSGGYYSYTLKVNATYYTTAAQEQQVDNAVKSLISTLNVSSASDYKKVKAVYDFMCKNIVYDYAGLAAGTDMCHTTYSAIIQHKTVCQGYASMFYRMMLEMGVDARLIAGDANSYSTGPNSGDDEHGWNIVELNDKYYNLDATWDAELHPNGQNYEYFLVSDANFPNHQPWSEYKTSAFKSQYPKSTTNFDPATEDKGSASNGWVLENGKWYYYANGVKKTGWLQYGKDWYYLNGNGVMVTGWMQYGSIWYYFGTDGKMATGKVTIGNEVHIFDASGVWQGQDYSATVTKGWQQEGGKWYYYKDGAKVTGWLDLNGTWYYFKTSGEMVTGWLAYGPVWYYFNPNGDMRLGWLTYGGKTYYFDKATTNYGRMAVNKWIQDSGKWYYFEGNGYMVTGTYTINGKQNKFDANGVWQGEIQTTVGWKQEGSKWYYYDANGVKATGWKTISEKTYYFDSTGAMKTGWLYLGGYYYYFNANGEMQTGHQYIGGEWYGFNSKGQMLTGWAVNGLGQKYYYNSDGTRRSGWLYTGGEYYYFGSDGVMYTGEHTIGGSTYYFDDDDGYMWCNTWAYDRYYNYYYYGSDGAMYKSGWYWINGTQHYFDSQGRCTTR